MKKSLIIPVLSLVGIVLAYLPTKAVSSLSLDNEERPVELWAQSSLSDSNTPRISQYVPITCSVDEASGYLNFKFLFQMGNATITLTQSINGVISSDSYSTSSLYLSIPVPYYGSYEVEIVLESGIVFVGYFEY